MPFYVPQTGIKTFKPYVPIMAPPEPPTEYISFGHDYFVDDDKMAHFFGEEMIDEEPQIDPRSSRDGMLSLRRVFFFFVYCFVRF